jgi:phosphoribosyl 1,2-cyclic phosphodiesterase/GAF domain-containing protein
MRVRFWGTRGSIAKAGPHTVRYGGNTSCVELRSAAGTLVVLDCGTGAHGLGQALLAAEPRALRGHVLISHTHWDHIQGIPFFAPLFVPGAEWDLYAPRGLGEQLRETLAGQMQYTYFPVSLDRLGATVRCHDLVEGVFRVGELRVTTQYLNHPALVLGYRLEGDGAVVVYATDHEPHSRAAEGAGTGSAHPGDRRHATFVAGADVLIHDAQYTAAEYPAKVGWGHSPVEYAVDTAVSAGVRRLVLFHHDPLRDDDEVERIVAAAQERAGNAGTEVLAAAEGREIVVHGTGAERTASRRADAPAIAGDAPVPSAPAVLVAVPDAPTATRLAEAILPDGIRLLRAGDADAALRLARSERPALVLVERDLPGGSGLGVCRGLRAEPESAVRDVPVILVADAEHPGEASAGVTDWLVRPFSPEYARTKVRAWLLRTRARWIRPPSPPDEPARLAAVRKSGLLDTAAEERFDRLTRLAQRLFEVPIALVSLVDAERQWFKSRQGLEVAETSRDAAFCAHAILAPHVMVVPDALADPRFADNPLVIGPPRVRFYAGQPVAAPDGSRIGTLCIIDHRPRDLSAEDVAALQDLARMVEEELRGTPPD